MGDLINTQGGDYAAGNIDKRSGTFTNVSIHEAPTPLALNLHQISPPPRDFTGRAAELTELLANFEKGVAISGLHGQGGIGKTALALKLAEQLMPRYPDAQFYLDLRGASDQKPLTVAEALSHVIRAYHPTSKLPEDEAQLRTLYQSVLHGQRALLLMDNAKDAAQVAPLLPPSTCCLLVTSRQHFHLPGIHTKNLDALPPDDAHHLLLTIAPRITPSPGPSPIGKTTDGGGVADQIANLCGYLPLALRLTASALAERVDLSPTDLIRKLTDTQQRLKLTGAEASLQLSYDLLTAELQKLWRALAVFPETFDRAAAAAVWELEADPAHEALGELVKYSLLQYAPHPAPLPSGERESLDGESPSPSGRGDRGEGEHQDRYRIHDLARLYADSRLSESECYEAQKRHAAHYETVLRAARELYLQGGEAITRGLNLFDLELKNLQAGQAWAAAQAGQDNAAMQLCSDYPDAGAYLLDLRQHPRERIRWRESALAAARRLKRRDAEGVHLGNLGIAYADLGETHKAIEFHEQRLAIAREIGDRRGEGAALGNLGVAYAAFGETRKVIEFSEQQLVIAREIGDQRSEGNALGNLGLAYADLGETRKAIKYHEQRLTIAREIGDQHGEGTALGNLGIAYADLGETRKAIEYHEQHLTIAHEIGDQRGEGNALGNLGNAYAALSETRKAIEYYKQHLTIAHKIGDQRGEGADRGNLGLAYAALGENRKAIEYYEQHLTIAREIGDRRGEGYVLWNMSLTLNKLGERAQAIAHAEAALKIHEEIEDPNAGKVRKGLEHWCKQASKKWWQFWK